MSFERRLLALILAWIPSPRNGNRTALEVQAGYPTENSEFGIQRGLPDYSYSFEECAAAQYCQILSRSPCGYGELLRINEFSDSDL